MKCPKCPDQPMRIETWPGTELERCPRCQGLYLDAGELDRMLVAHHAGRVDSQAFTPLSDHHDRKPGICDRCRLEMAPYLGPQNVRLDRCPKCHAVFLDQGELAHMRTQ
jgi:uncharacterized protein